MLGLVMNLFLVCRLARHIQPRKWLPLLLVIFSCISDALILSLQFFSGLVTSEVVHHFIYCLLPLLAGVFTGMRLFDTIDQSLYKRTIYILLFALGAMMLLKGAGGFGGWFGKSKGSHLIYSLLARHPKFHRI